MIVSATNPQESLFALTWNLVPYTQQVTVPANESVDIPCEPPLMDAVWSPGYLVCLAISPPGSDGDFTLAVKDALTGQVLITFSGAKVLELNPLSCTGRVGTSGRVVLTLTNTTGSDIDIDLFYGYQR